MFATVNPGAVRAGAGLPRLLRRRGHIDHADAAATGAGTGAGLAVSAGFAAAFTVAGLLVPRGLRSLVGAVPWVAVAIGGILVPFGLAIFAGRHRGVRVHTGCRSRSSNAHRGHGRLRRRVVLRAVSAAAMSGTLARALRRLPATAGRHFDATYCSPGREC